MKKIPFIEQTNNQDCGLACIAMLLAQKKKHITIDMIRERFKVGSNGLNMENLFHILKFYGADTICGKSEKIENFLTPSIVHLHKGHFVLLEKVQKGYVYIIDPASGRKKYPKNQIEKHFSEYFIYINKIDKTLPKSYKKPNFKPFIKLILGLIFVSIIMQIMLIQVPLLIKELTDNIYTLDIIKISPFIGILIFIFLLTTWLRGILIISLENKLDYSIMRKFILKLVAMPLSEFSLRNKGDLVFRATANDIIKQILSSKIISLFIDSIFLFFYSYLLLNLYVPFGILIILLSVIVFMILAFTTPKIMELTDIDVAAKSDIQTFYTELIGRITDIKTQNLESTYFTQWKSFFSKQLSSFKKRESLNNTLNTLVQGYQFSLPLIIFILGISQVKNDHLSIGSLLAINTLGTMFIAPVVSLSNTFTEIIYVKSYISKVTDIINYHVPQKKKNNYERKDFKHSLKIKNLSFSYGSFEKKVLKNINMEIPANKKVAIVGKSGSGKSTLLKVLAGVYSDYEGEITINGKELSTHNYNNHVGVILQESGLFNQSIKNNISKGISNEECLKLLNEMNFKKEFENLPYGLETKINEDAQNFSGGQIQKILLARSLVNNPLLLLCDEATSALDNENQRIINKKLRSKNITQIIVAHRLSTVLDADFIYVLENGEIVEQGHPKELLSTNSIFSKMLNGGMCNE